MRLLIMFTISRHHLPAYLRAALHAHDTELPRCNPTAITVVVLIFFVDSTHKHPYKHRRADIRWWFVRKQSTNKTLVWRGQLMKLS